MMEPSSIDCRFWTDAAPEREVDRAAGTRPGSDAVSHRIVSGTPMVKFPGPISSRAAAATRSRATDVYIVGDGRRVIRSVRYATGIGATPMQPVTVLSSVVAPEPHAA